MAKYDSTKFYWLQLKEDFFDEDAISWLEEQPNGKEYSLFYLKLCLKSLKTSGILIRRVGELLIPYDHKKLGELTKTNPDTVLVAMQLLSKIGLVKTLDNGELYLTQVEELIGSQSKSAFKKQQQRLTTKEENLLENNEGGQMSTNCPPKIEIDIELDKEIDIKQEVKKDNKKPVKNTYGEFKNVKLTDEEYSKLKSEFAVADDAIKFLDEYIAEKGYKSKSHYLAIRRWVIDAVSKNKPNNSYNKQDQEPKETYVAPNALYL